MPPRYRGAYTTVQTVLNRLADRDLLSRRREGNAIVYRPRMTEDQYLTETIDATLAGASPTARQAALAQLIGEMEEDELSTLRDLAREIGRKRRSKRR